MKPHVRISRMDAPGEAKANEPTSPKNIDRIRRADTVFIDYWESVSQEAHRTPYRYWNRLEAPNGSPVDMPCDGLCTRTQTTRLAADISGTEPSH